MSSTAGVDATKLARCPERIGQSCLLILALAFGTGTTDHRTLSGMLDGQHCKAAADRLSLRSGYSGYRRLVHWARSVVRTISIMKRWSLARLTPSASDSGRAGWTSTCLKTSAGTHADILVANILDWPISRLAPQLQRCQNRGAAIALSDRRGIFTAFACQQKRGYLVSSCALHWIR